jgi:hypothetical protein
MIKAAGLLLQLIQCQQHAGEEAPAARGGSMRPALVVVGLVALVVILVVASGKCPCGACRRRRAEPVELTDR